jgi:predicted subunit of tRNA(5-methylaminomethyl-2-thiouridylate) methyltransferase
VRVSKRLRFMVLQRDGFRCRYCGATAREARLEVDHIVPVSAGGPDVAANLATACFDCNRGKKHYALPAAEIKRLVLAHEPPRRRPAPIFPEHRDEGMVHISTVLHRVYDAIDEAHRAVA